MKTDLSARFWAKVDKTSTCWNWTASLRSKNSPYGNFKVLGKTKLAHRISYELLVGTIPEGLTIDHTCKNTKCVNPSHMELVTLSENVRRAEVWKNTNPGQVNRDKSYCPKGHPYDSINTYTTPSGKRDCKECRRAACRKNYRKVKDKSLSL